MFTKLVWLRLALLAAVCGPLNASDSARNASFEAQVLPILQTRCLTCHGEPPVQAQLDLRTAAGILRGGKSGPAVVPGSADQSLLLGKVVSGTMPPVGEKLSDGEIGAIRKWIDDGASFERASHELLVTEREVLPIFQMRCVTCHGKRRQEAGLDLRTPASRMKGGKSGPALVPGKPEESLLFQRVASGEMPPPDMLFENQVRPPRQSEVEILRKWIAAGAPEAPEEPSGEVGQRPPSKEEGKFWAFQPPQRPGVPEVRHRELVRNPIDAFLLKGLEKKNLSFSALASREQLIRRAYLDLIGMPPTIAEVTEFVKDRRPDAYDQMVNRLLGSPHYGERWAQIWLDLAGYADSEGVVDEDRERPHAWRYRDYVIRALNQDKPYDQFLTEQLAGDELIDYENLSDITQETVDTLAATGFLRMAADGTYSTANGSVVERINVIADELQVLSSAVMGLTIGCARCHDHKYDPISQADYYRLSAIFQTSLDPYDWAKPTERYLDIGLKKERQAAEQFNPPIEAALARLKEAFAAKINPLYERELEKRLSALSGEVRSDLRTVAATPKEKRTPIQRSLAQKFKEVLQIPNADGEFHQIVQAFPEIKEEAGKINNEIKRLTKELWPTPKIRALYDMGGEPSPAYLLARGDAEAIGPRVYPGVPQIFSDGLQPYVVKPPKPGGKTSGNRLAFARWLTQPKHPLTARVMVNRVWQGHFGKGLVGSPSNFGRTAPPPANPELLDWLATEFQRGAWSIKALHRLIMTSTAYRQASRAETEAETADPENKLLSRMPLRRMDAEVLHDSILHATGRLDLTQFGRPVPVTKKDNGEIVADPSGASWRRAIYVLKRRRTPMTQLDVFDFPQLSPNCTERAESTVAPQALQMVNSEGVLSHARYLAGRLIDEFPGERLKQVEQLYLQVLSRRPKAKEINLALKDLVDLEKHWRTHLEKNQHNAPRETAARWFALGSLAHALLNSSDFLYVD